MENVTAVIMEGPSVVPATPPLVEFLKGSQSRSKSLPKIPNVNNRFCGSSNSTFLHRVAELSKRLLHEYWLTCNGLIELNKVVGNWKRVSDWVKFPVTLIVLNVTGQLMVE